MLTLHVTYEGTKGETVEKTLEDVNPPASNPAGMVVFANKEGLIMLLVPMHRLISVEFQYNLVQPVAQLMH